MDRRSLDALDLHHNKAQKKFNVPKKFDVLKNFDNNNQLDEQIRKKFESEQDSFNKKADILRSLKNGENLTEDEHKILQAHTEETRKNLPKETAIKQFEAQVLEEAKQKLSQPREAHFEGVGDLIVRGGMKSLSEYVEREYMQNKDKRDGSLSNRVTHEEPPELSPSQTSSDTVTLPPDSPGRIESHNSNRHQPKIEREQIGASKTLEPSERKGRILPPDKLQELKSRFIEGLIYEGNEKAKIMNKEKRIKLLENLGKEDPNNTDTLRANRELLETFNQVYNRQFYRKNDNFDYSNHNFINEKLTEFWVHIDDYMNKRDIEYAKSAIRALQAVKRGLPKPR